MTTMDAYEVLALRYATHERPASANLLYPPGADEDPHDGPTPLDDFVWVCRNAERIRAG